MSINLHLLSRSIDFGWPWPISQGHRLNSTKTYFLPEIPRMWISCGYDEWPWPNFARSHLKLLEMISRLHACTFKVIHIKVLKKSFCDKFSFRHLLGSIVINYFHLFTWCFVDLLPLNWSTSICVYKYIDPYNVVCRRSGQDHHFKIWSGEHGEEVLKELIRQNVEVVFNC